MIVYFNGKYVSLEEAKISPYDRGFHYADGVYEALRSYNGKLFRVDSHMRRLKYSLTELNIKLDDINQFESVSLQLAEINKILPHDFSVYIQVTRGVQFPRKHNYENNPTHTVFVSVSKLKDNSEHLEKGVKIILEEDIRWTRCDIKSISLLPSVMAKTKAVNLDAYEAVFHRDDLITEGSHTNFFAVKKGVVYTAPLSNFILEGITREVIIELCIKNKIRIEEEYIKVSDIKNYDEFFITGTTTEITPVIQIDDWVVGNGSPGKLTRVLQKYFQEHITSFN
ncbi:MAG: D-amino-acid transaminase [Ignavibacterium sp.]|nr:D-amino-acid transaminase [Ignavibacterium sp.]